MYQLFAKKLFGTKHDREVKRMLPLVEQINQFEPRLQALTDAAIQSRIAEIKGEILKGLPLLQALPEVFALVREASVRILKMRHFDVQMMGGIALHEGKIAEMKTGEGKTLAATLAVSLNALTGKGVHVITVNDYLAKRDAEWMGKIYNFLGLSVGMIVHDLSDHERQISYNSDITYGTNNEFGFDYLRDNMKLDPTTLVQRDLHYAIVDEVDSILIDEARTPLIISGPAEESTEKYSRINRIIPALKKDTDYTVDEKSKTVVLTEEHGVPSVEKALGIENLFDILNSDTLHHVNQALRAHVLFKLDTDYVVQNDQVVIVDEFTGRLMPGRRWSDGLHQAIEAKEGVKIENENQTLASITFQNYFRIYEKLAGMTGTADTEAAEFAKIYRLDVMVIPTNQPMIRKDLSDQVFKTEKEKFKAAIGEIKERHANGQPILVGTISIEKSEHLSTLLKREGVKHNVLNAKHHEREADIVAQAGRKGAVTISTNMAGRGTDIMLGGNPDFMARAKANLDEEPERYQEFLTQFREQTQKEREAVVAAGGLHIIGTERHESRRIDNQLRGRSGRQGDPGSSRFYLSLEDDLLRIFGAERISSIMDRLGMEEDQPIEHPWLNRSIEGAQTKVEAHNFNMRKNVLEYDDVMNQQRQAFYSWRKQVLRGNSISELTHDLIADEVNLLAEEVAPKKIRPQEWNWDHLNQVLQEVFGTALEIPSTERETYTYEKLHEKLREHVFEAYRKREQDLSTEILRHLERVVSLQTMDQLWKDHLLQMDHLKEGIGLRGYAQKDPLLEYKKEGFDLFIDMENRIRADVVKTLFRAQVATPEQLSEMQERQKRVRERMSMQFQQAGPTGQPAAPVKPKTGAAKVGRNDPCPCGSGKKYKKCCGA